MRRWTPRKIVAICNTHRRQSMSMFFLGGGGGMVKREERKRTPKAKLINLDNVISLNSWKSTAEPMIAASVKRTNCVGITSYQHPISHVASPSDERKSCANKKQTLLWNLIKALFNHLICPKLVPPTTAKQAHVTPLFHAPTKSPLKRLESAFVASTVKPPKRAQIPTSIVRWTWPKEELDRKRRGGRRRREKRV